MESSSSADLQASKRSQLAAERLLENSSLRDALTDDQAQRLLDWGLAQVERVAHDTADLPDEEAEPLLDEMTTAVSRVMKQVNRLVDSAGTLDESETQERWQQLLDNLRQVRNEETSAEVPPESPAPDWTQAPDALFDELLDIITARKEEHDQTQAEQPDQCPEHEPEE